MLLLHTKSPQLLAELKPWAMIPMILFSGLLLGAYVLLFKWSMRRMKQFIARKEKKLNVTVLYHRYGVTLNGRINAFDSLVFHLQIIFGYLLAMMLPLAVVGSAVILIPDSWVKPFFKEEPSTP